MRELSLDSTELEKSESFLNDNKGMILSLAKKYSLVHYEGIDTENIFEAASAAYARAKEKYNPNKGVKLSNVLFWMLQKEFKELIKGASQNGKKKNKKSRSCPMCACKSAVPTFSGNLMCSRCGEIFDGEVPHYEEVSLYGSNGNGEGEGEYCLYDMVQAESNGDEDLEEKCNIIIEGLHDKVSIETIRFMQYTYFTSALDTKENKEMFVSRCLGYKSNVFNQKLKKAVKDIKKSNLKTFRGVCRNGNVSSFVLWAPDIDQAKHALKEYGELLEIKMV